MTIKEDTTSLLEEYVVQRRIHREAPKIINGLDDVTESTLSTFYS